MTAAGQANLPNFLKHVEPFSCLNVDEAADSPGLYAWYGLLKAGPQDWQMRFIDGDDLGTQACRTLLQRHTVRHASPPLQLEARGTFSSFWRGDLRDATTERLSALLARELTTAGAEASGDEPDTEQLEGVLASPRMREILISVLQVATPILSAPIYIGVATSLRNRLRQHTDQLFKLSDFVSKNPESRQDLLNSSKSTFATRAIGMGFTVDTLCVWTLNLTNIYPNKSDQDVLRKVAQTAEWLLNRWHRPMLGKR